MTTSERPERDHAAPARPPAPAMDPDAWLDHALEDTFPASDPIAVRLLSAAELGVARRKDAALI